MLFLAILVITTLSLSVRATTVDDFSQCANGQLPSTETGCEDWTSGNLNSQNSHYREDEVVPQRLVLDLTSGSLTDRTITLSYQTLKNSIHAFDSFATWNLTQQTASRCQDLSVCPNGPFSTLAIPDDPAAVPPSGDNISNITSNHMIPAGSGRLITMYGGTITGVSVPEHSGSDDIATFTVTYSVPSLPTKVMFLFGSHLAASFGVRGWGDNLGASNINGGSYHVTLDDADGTSVGKRSNGIQAGSVLPQPGVITIKKVTIPSPDPTSASFDFSSVSEQIPDFSLANAQSMAFTLDSDTYNITESNPSPNFLLTDISCESDAGSGYSADINTRSVYIILANAGNVTCTFTNTLQEPSLVIKKIVINDNGGTALSSNFTMHVDATNPSSNDFAGSEDGTAITLEPGSYNVSETGLDGYAAIFSSDCAGAISYGESKTCTITNDDISPQLTVIKNVVNDNGGTAQSSDFTMNISAENPSLSSFSGSENGTTIALNAGLYNVSESGPNGYIANFSSECSGSISIGETKTCAITNDDNAATLTVIKTVVNDNGGALTAADFELFIDNAQVTSGQANLVLAGNHIVSENVGDGYEASTWGGDCNSDGTVTLLPGDSKICAITNNDIAPTLNVIKTVVNDNGGTLSVEDFELFINETQVASSQPNTLDAGYYAVSENNVEGYQASGFGGDCNPDGSITLAPGDNATCTITNDDTAPTLTVIKTVVNDNGGTLTPADFQLFINNSETNSGDVNTLSAGSYAVTENNVDGYLASSFGGDCNADGSITLAPGDNATCTITNDDIPAHLTVIKTVVNDDGGALQVSDFPLFINGTQVISGQANTLSVGSYSVTETNAEGYSSAFGGDCNPDGSINLALGDNATCTITNDDEPATLIVVKTVVNDEGGTLTVEDFPLFINDSQVASGQTNILSAGTYVVSETNANGYEASAFGGDCNTDGTIILLPGDEKICTITNDDIAPTLTIIKTVINDNGGSLTALDFSLFINNTQVNSGDVNTLSAGLYTVSEAQEEGYAASDYGGDCNADGTIILAPGDDAVCTITNDDIAATITLVKNVINDNGGSAAPNDFQLLVDGNIVASNITTAVDANTPVAIDENLLEGYEFVSITGDVKCPSELGQTVTLDEGESITCTITNDDIAPTLTITKVVVNDNGGNNVVSDFNLFVDETQVVSGEENTFDAGSYTVSESQLNGYASTISGDCSSDGTVTLSPGDNAACTITNNDIPSQLTVIKQVINDNGGAKQVNDFQLLLNNSQIISGQVNVLDAGTYAVSEVNLEGYESTISGDCDEDGIITLASGQNATCTITNDDIAPQITLIKNVENNYGGNAQPDDFQLTIGNNLILSGSTTEVDANTPIIINENLLDGYGFVSITGNEKCPSQPGQSVILYEGENITCIITNDDKPSYVTLIKNVINDDNGNAQPDDFDLTLNNNIVPSGVAQQVTANAPLTINEADVDGYEFVSITGNEKCPSVLGGSLTLDEGENITCTITNDDIAPTLKVIKVVINDDGGTLQASDFALFIDNAEVVNGEVNTLVAGDYIVSEATNSGYESAILGDCSADGSVSLAPGDDKTCTITNNDIAPTLTVVKTVVNDNGGTLSVVDFTLFIDETQVFSGETNTLSAGIYLVSETNQQGYSASAFGGDCNEDGSIILSPGENAVCAITNDDIAPTLTIVKNVINDNGGTLTVEDFPLFIDDDDVNSGEENILSAGTYVVSETNANGYEASEFGGDCNSDGTITLSLDQDAVCTITNDDVPGQIHGTKFEDVNGNGIWDEDEPGLSSWLIILWVDGDILDVQETDEDGNYWFMDLDVGTYTISENVEEGWIQTLPFIPSYDINIELGTVSEDNNFGNFELGSIHGMKFEDLNRNSQRDEEEPGLDGWTIYLDANENGILDEDEQYTLTDENGNYWFMGLDARIYLVREVAEDGWAQTFPEAGYEVGIQSGIVSENNDFGNFKLATVNGFVFGDIDGDGVQDENETGLEDSNVIISRVNEIFNETTNETVIETEIVALTLTGTDGVFSFTINESGQYRITSQNEGFETTYPLDSFFDVFVDDVSGAEITVDVNSNSIVFGSHKLPVINDDVAVENVTTNSVVITWTTDVNSTSQVVYHIFPQDNVSGYVFSTEEFDVNLTVTNHSVTITGLESNTTYFFRVVSGITNSSPEAFSDEFSFTTLPLTITSSDDGPISTGSSGGGSGGGGSGGGSSGGRGGHYIWDCEEWSACYDDGTQTRTCRYMNDVTVEITRVDTQSCTPQSSDDDSGSGSCLEVWTCTDWSSCSPDSTQTRVCTDQNECGTDLYKPEESQFCVYEQDELEEGQPAITGAAITNLFKPSSFLWLLILLIILALMYYYYSEIYKKNIKK